MKTINAETYTNANGSNMDSIEYNASAPFEEIVNDLHTYDNWDYAILSGDDGEIIATVYNGDQAANVANVVSLTEAAEMLGVSRQRVHVLLKNGQLEGYKVGNTWSVYRESVESRREGNK